jgi:hypothetical protein
VDDILIAYRQSLSNIHEVLNKFNNLTPKLQFTLAEETNNCINFLDITITKTTDRLSYKIYRKPTTTNSIIPFDSCHPIQHKLAAIRFLTNRRDSYHLDRENKQMETGIIDQILHTMVITPHMLTPHPCHRPPPKFHIYCETKWNIQINDKNTVQPNAIYKNLVRMNLDLDHQPPPPPARISIALSLSSSPLSTRLNRHSGTIPVSETKEHFRSEQHLFVHVSPNFVVSPHQVTNFYSCTPHKKYSPR